jgi:IS1 family transposase
MVQRRGMVRAQVVQSRDAGTIREFVTENAKAGSAIMTDEWRGYHNLHDLYKHEVVNHSIEYVRDNIHTNSIENFWSLLKRTIKGTYVSVSPEHLQKYIEEQAFRYNERYGNDQERFVSMIGLISGKRLTYAKLVGCEI